MERRHKKNSKLFLSLEKKITNKLSHLTIDDKAIKDQTNIAYAQNNFF